MISAMTEGTSLYDRDFVEWTEEQATRLRAAAGTHPNLHLDWENLAEEIESLGKSDERELSSRLTTIIEHLLKLGHPPAQEPRAGWRRTVRRERMKVAAIVQQSPRLRAKLDRLLPQANRSAAKLVCDDFEDRGEIAPALLARLSHQEFNPDQVLGDWLPD